ncbi:glycosyl transferase family 2 [Chryseobacterium sp. FH2]|uniref:glycosyltransferase family 2 protein n=1 Tax=Chryseobacterium sp. FH2 TaxID=1674291 RepID=UPI00065AFCDB|nr:glycosyltransferase [Chryseobacterium sp. FH2]KMQ68251.1 glycosyl transferase family 2 [Chryseobacterium sp. FH2]
MTFSILVANYNNGKFFKKCYDSIISQKYTDWEAIILDDCSTDNSLELINELIKGDNRFKLFENEVNCGVGVTKAKLIDLANGEICGFVDPDDAIGSKALLSSVNIFKKNKDIVLTYSKFVKCDENLQPVEVSKQVSQALNNDPYFFNCPVNIVHFVSFRKQVYLQTEKINILMRIAEDQDLYLKMYEKGKVRFINENNYFYRTHSGGISQNQNRPKSREYFAEVIFNAMKRRKLKTINGKPVPESFTDSKEIYNLLKYQTSFSFRIRKKIRIFVQQVFN